MTATYDGNRKYLLENKATNGVQDAGAHLIAEIHVDFTSSPPSGKMTLLDDPDECEFIDSPGKGESLTLYTEFIHDLHVYVDAILNTKLKIYS